MSLGKPSGRHAQHRGSRLHKAWRYSLSALGLTARPNFLLIGAQKAGTTALHRMLCQHSLLFSANPKELHYFDNEGFYQKPVNRYHAHFPLRSRLPAGARCFESTPAYLHGSRIAERLWRYNPRLRLIALLRDPAERAYSAWRMYHHQFRTGPYAAQHDPRPFAQAIAEELAAAPEASGHAYIARGCYAPQLQAFLDFFPREQLLTLESSQLRTAPEATLSRVCEFVQVPPETLPALELNRAPSSASESELPVMAQLRRHYKPYNAQLYEMLNQKFDWPPG